MKTIFSLLLLCAARSALAGFQNGSITLSSHSYVPTEGETVELTCNIASTSLPATNRSKLYYYWMIYYSWSYDLWISYTISSGPALDRYGNTVSGYSFKNDGRILVIDSVRYNDKYFLCRGSDDEKTYPDYFKYEDAFGSYCLQIIHKPYIGLYIYPESKKFNAAINKTVSLLFECEAYPPHSPKRSWTFVNFDGVSKNLPPNSDIEFFKSDCFNYCSLKFNFTSIEYYGNYSFTVTNDMGSATITFQVLPEGPPDAPLNVVIKYVKKKTIVVEWNIMWSNSFDGHQTVFWQLTQVENGTIVESSNASYNDDYDYNSTDRYRFDKNIEPETNYKVSVWSINKFGKSQVVEMDVETQKDPNLNFPSSLLLCFWVLLGVMSTALIAVLIAYLMKRFKCNRQPQQLSQIAMHEVNAGSPQSDAGVVYESVKVNLQNDEHTYTSISQTRSQDP